MLFEELIEQHRVHLVVADAVGFSLLIMHHQIRIYLFDFFGDQSELRGTVRINVLLVAERHRPESKELFAGFFRGPDFFLEPFRGTDRAKLVIWVNQDRDCADGTLPVDVADKAAVVFVRAMDRCADTDHVVGGGDIVPSYPPNGNIAVAGRIITERCTSNSHVEDAKCVTGERPVTNGRVVSAARIVAERCKAYSGVAVPDGVVQHR